MAFANPPDEFDWLIPEPDPELVRVFGDPGWAQRTLGPIRDAAGAEKARLRAAKRAAAEAAARDERPAS